MMNKQIQKRIVAFIGSYSDPSSPGIYACEFDFNTGMLLLKNQVSGLKNPTFLDVDQANRRLYAISEGNNSRGQRWGEVAAIDIEFKDSIRLNLLNKEQSVTASTCHITLDQTRQCLMVSSYHGGMIGLNPILKDGRIGLTTSVHLHKGSSVLPIQNSPRPHSVTVDRLNRFAIVCDLGLDQILIYQLDIPEHKLNPHHKVKVTPGSGPRHFVFHPTLAYGYAINELNSTITVFTYEEENGLLNEIQTVSTLPEFFTGENDCADIHISPDGQYLYGSNRGHDSIVIYAIDNTTGKLNVVDHESTLGRHPRNFALSPDGRFLLVANRESNNIVSFSRDSNSGKLNATGSVLELSEPVCIKFMSLT